MMQLYLSIYIFFFISGGVCFASCEIKLLICLLILDEHEVDAAILCSKPLNPSWNSSTSLWLLTRAKMAGVVAKREGPQFISEVAVRGNAAVLDYCRTSVSALSGATAGILGLTGLYGFIFYFLSAFLLSLLLILKAGRRWNKFFKSRRLLFTGGLVGGLFTYVLFWTFLYGMVHVY